MNEQKIEFYLITKSLGEIRLYGEDWNKVTHEIYDKWVNCGKMKIVKRTYTLISEEPYIIDTDYNA